MNGNHQIRTAVRLPEELIVRVKRVAKAERSTFSQFVRTAVVEKLDRRKAQAA